VTFVACEPRAIHPWRLAPVGEQRVPLDDIELDVEEALGELCCTNSFIEIGCIWPEPEAEVWVFTSASWPPRSRPRSSACGRHPVILDLEFRIAAPGMAKLEGAGCRHHQAAEQVVHHGVAVDTQVRGLAHADVIPGRALDAAELPGPHMRLLVLCRAQSRAALICGSASGDGASIQSPGRRAARPCGHSAPALAAARGDRPSARAPCPIASNRTSSSRSRGTNLSSSTARARTRCARTHPMPAWRAPSDHSCSPARRRRASSTARRGHVEVGQVDRQAARPDRGRQFDRHLVDRFRARRFGMRVAVTPT